MRSLRRFRSRLTRSTAFISLAALVSVSCAEPNTLNAGESDDAGRIAPSELIVTPENAAAAWYDGDHATAVDMYRRLVAENPDNQDYRLSLVVLLREDGKIEEAFRYSAELSRPHAVEHEMNLALAGVAPGNEDVADTDDLTDFDIETEVADPATSRYHFWRGVRSCDGEYIFPGGRSLHPSN